jgi:hypothetical protein
MFQLDSAIQSWRRQMISAGIYNRDTLNELESHLRDDIEQQVRAGQTEQHAFEIAAEKIGKANALKAEFAKDAAVARTLTPNLLRNCCVVSAAFMLLVNTWTLLEYELSLAERSLGLSVVALLALYIGGLPYLNRLLLHGSRRTAIRKATVLVCAFFLVLWEILALGSAAKIIHLPAGLLLEGFAWNLFAAMAATILVLHYSRDDESFDALDWNSFTPLARETLEIAGTEALRFHHDFIGTEHLLLGLLGSEKGIVPRVLKKMGVSGDIVRIEIEKFVGTGPECSPSISLRYTPRAKKALELAVKQCRTGRTQVGVEQIFLGLILEDSGVAALVLKNLGVNITAAREAILKEADQSPD